MSPVFCFINNSICLSGIFNWTSNFCKPISATFTPFNSNISSAIIGNDDYSLEFNQDGSENIALLKANSTKARETSFVVKTNSGLLFNINIKYGNSPKNIIQVNDSLGVQISQRNNENSKVVSNEKTNIREDDYTIGNTVINDNQNKKVDCEYCDKLVKTPKTIKRIFDESFKVKLQINNLYYFDNKLFFVINITNSSNIDYNINYIKSYIDTKKDSKNASAQYLEKNPSTIYNANRTIQGNTNKSFIFIYDQFTVDSNKHLTFEINENNGERNLALRVPAFIINNPVNIKKLK